MMKKILFALAFLVCLVSSAQIKPNHDGVNLTPLTTVEINALTGMLEGDIQYNSTTETLWRYNGTAWADTGGSGISNVVEDTTPQLGGVLDLNGYSIQEDIYPSSDNTYTLGRPSSSFLNSYVFNSYIRHPSTAATDDYDWRFRTSPTTNTFEIGVEDAEGTGVYTNLYTFNGTGTPSAATDLINKAYADANYSGGGASQLSDLSDVNTSTPTNRNVLVADGVDFESRPLVEADISDLGSYVDLTSAQIVTSGFKSFNGNIFSPQYYFGYSDGTSGRRWRMVQNNISNLIRFDYQDVASTDPDSGSFTTIYTMDPSGTPSAATDLIDKAYADANYAGGGSLPVDDTTALVQDPVDNTKQARIDAGAITTGTTRVLTMPDADVDLGNIPDLNTVSPPNVLEYARFSDSNTLEGLTAAEVRADLNIEINAAADQTNSLSGTGNKDLTISGTGGNTIDLTGVDGIDPDNIVSDITGVTGGTQYSNVYGQTEAGQIADGTPPAGTLSICTDCYPYIEVALSDYATDLTTGTSKAYWRAPFAMEVMEVRASVLTAPTGANIIVDINENGTSIFTTNLLTIDNGVKGTGALTLTANAANTETVTIGAKTYTFQTTLTDVDGNILIGATASDSIDNLIAAITGGAGAGTTYAASTITNTDVTAVAGVGDTMDITTLVEESTAYATTETLVNGSWGNVTVTGGADPEKTSVTAATAANITDNSIADDAEITFDIDQIGSTIAGAGLLVKIYYK